MDPLSQVIEQLRPQALEWRVIEAHAPWTLRFPAIDAVVFGQQIEGHCRVERQDGMTLDVGPGDFLLMAAPPAWTLSPPGGGPTTDFEAVIDDPGRLLGPAPAPETTRFIAGYFVFAAENAELVASLMLPVIHVRAAEVEMGRLGALLKLLEDEALAERPARSLVLDRLLELTLVECLRRRPAHLTDLRPGLLTGLADPQIAAALAMIHGGAQRPWTVSELAREAGMSRSSFAARFAKTVGASPIDYLATWRMTLAKTALTTSRRPMSQIAEIAGYQSVSAFSTAFSRATGLAPTAYRLHMAEPP